MYPETNFDRAFIEIPIRTCSKEAQIEIWEKELKELNSLEMAFRRSHNLIKNDISFEFEFPSQYHFQQLERVIQAYGKSLDSMFTIIHMAAYFDGLLKDIQGK